MTAPLTKTATLRLAFIPGLAESEKNMAKHNKNMNKAEAYETLIQSRNKLCGSIVFTIISGLAAYLNSENTRDTQIQWSCTIYFGASLIATSAKDLYKSTLCIRKVWNSMEHIL